MDPWTMGLWDYGLWTVDYDGPGPLGRSRSLGGTFNKGELIP